MKKTNHALLPSALAAGAAGIVLRLLLYRTSFDDRGLLNPGDPLHILCWVLAIGLALFLLLRLRREEVPGLILPRGLRISSALAAAALLALCTRTLIPDARGGLQWTRTLLCGATAAAAVLHALALAGRKNLHPAIHVVPCLYFAADMLCRYQTWSGNPQLADYCFALAASVCLCLAAYQRLALPARLGSRKIHLFCSVMGLCLCMFSTVGPEGAMFYGAGAFWILTGADAAPGKEKGHAPS